MSPAAYAIIRDEDAPREQRLAAYNDRTEWVAPLTGTTAGQMEEMVRVFGNMGLLENKSGIENDPDCPPEILVASFGPDIPEPTALKARPELAAAPPEEGRPAPRRIGWGTNTDAGCTANARASSNYRQVPNDGPPAQIEPTVEFGILQQSYNIEHAIWVYGIR